MKGILMTPSLIPAIVEGRKTQTRRLDGLKEINREPDAWYLVASFDDNTLFRFGSDKYDEDILVKPRYQVGETVYIKEALLLNRIFGEASYRDGSPVFIYNEQLIKTRHILAWRWQRDSLSPLHCPQEAARHFITILAVRAERLQGITNEDAIAEGIIPPEHAFVMIGSDIDAAISPKEEYAELWDSINPTYPFESNPWVLPYEFEFVKER